MCFAVTIKCARLRIISKTHRAVLVCDSGERNALAEEQIPGNKAFVAVVPVNRAFGLLLHQALEFFNQTLVPLFVIWFVLQHDFAVASELSLRPGWPL